MNQEDSAATPMTTAFTNKPNFTPFTVVPNRTSLTLGYTASHRPRDDAAPDSISVVAVQSAHGPE